MKYVILFLSVVLNLFAIHTKAGTPSVGFANSHRVVDARVNAIQASKSILVKKYDFSTRSVVPLAAYDCDKYKRIQTTGIVLLSVGGATFAGGVTMMAFGVANAYNDGDGLLSAGLIGGGAVGTVLGVGMMGAGTALTIVGSVKLKKYCGNTTSSTRNFYLNPTTAHGIGFAARF